MSSSVNVTGHTTPITVTSEREQVEVHQLINQTDGSGAIQSPILINHSLVAATDLQHQQQQALGANSGLQQFQSNQQQQSLPQHAPRLFEASEPVPSRQSQYHWPPYTSPQQLAQAVAPLHYSQQFQPQVRYAPLSHPFAPANNQWQVNALPTSSEASPSVAEAYEPQEPGEEEADETGQGGVGEEVEEDPQAEDDGQQAAAASSGGLDYERPLRQDEPEDDDEADSQADWPMRPQSELEEISNRRSFNELKSDSRERDKDGHLIVTRRRHLINGKPVKLAQQLPPLRRQQQLERTQRSNADSSEASSRANRDNNIEMRLPLATAASHEDETLEDSADLRRASPRGSSVRLNRRQQEEGGDDDADDDHDDSGELAAASSSASERDFERMVNEIDQEDKLRLAAAAKVTPPNGSVSVSSDQLRRNDAEYQQEKQQPALSAPPSNLSVTNTNRPDTLARRNDNIFAPSTVLRPGETKAGGLHLKGVEKRQQGQRPALALVLGQSQGTLRQTINESDKESRGPDSPPVSVSSSSSSPLPLAPPAAQNSHEHRIQETLEAQQWDDDSSSMPDGQEIGSSEEELSEDEDKDQVENIVERDEEARQLEKLSHDLLKDSSRVPKELERRKRQATGSSMLLSASASPSLSSTTPASQPDRRQTDDGRKRAPPIAPTGDHGSDGNFVDDEEGRGDHDHHQHSRRPPGSNGQVPGLASARQASGTPPPPDPLRPWREEPRSGELDRETRHVEGTTIHEPPSLGTNVARARARGRRPAANTTGLSYKPSLSLRPPDLVFLLDENEQIHAKNGSDESKMAAANWKVRLEQSEKQAKPPKSSNDDDLKPMVEVLNANVSDGASFGLMDAPDRQFGSPNGVITNIANGSAAGQMKRPSGAPPSVDMSNRMNAYTDTILATEASGSSIGLAPGATWKNADVINGSEDMHVAVLTNPSGTAANSTQQQWPILQPAPAPAGNGPAPMPAPFYGPGFGLAAPSGMLGGGRQPEGSMNLASDSHKVAKKSKNRLKKKFAKKKRSKLVDSKYKAVEAYANKQKRRMKKGDMRKKKRKSEKEMFSVRKDFEGLAKGKKLGHGHKANGGKKGSAYLKDKGYKKKGFKRSYHKLETGDHKTYFDEFRDKDHHKKWKDFDDKHKYSQKKKWAGHDSKHMNQHKLRYTKGRGSKLGKWREKFDLKHMKGANKYKKSRNSGSVEGSLHRENSKKKKPKKKKKKTTKHYEHH